MILLSRRGETTFSLSLLSMLHESMQAEEESMQTDEEELMQAEEESQQTDEEESMQADEELI